MSIVPLTGLLSYSEYGHAKGPRPLEQRRKSTSPMCKLVENAHWSVMICILWVLMSIKVTVMELVGGGSASPELAVKARVPWVLYMSPSSVALSTHRPTF